MLLPKAGYYATNKLLTKPLCIGYLRHKTKCGVYLCTLYQGCTGHFFCQISGKSKSRIPNIRLDIRSGRIPDFRPIYGFSLNSELFLINSSFVLRNKPTYYCINCLFAYSSRRTFLARFVKAQLHIWPDIRLSVSGIGPDIVYQKGQIIRPAGYPVHPYNVWLLLFIYSRSYLVRQHS